MGIFDTIVDEQGRRHQTKWIAVGAGGVGPSLARYRIGDRVPALDGNYDASEEGEGTETVVAVRHGRVVGVRRPGARKATAPSPAGALEEALDLLRDLYNNDVLFVELSHAEKRAYDERLRAVLDRLGAEHDGREP